MSFGNTFENDLMKLVFNGTAIPNIADNAASAPLTDLYVGLHTADPGEGGDQTTSECSYGSYARIPVSRSSSGWTVTGNAITNAGAITFPTATSGSETATHFSIGTAPTGAGKILARGALTTGLPISTGIQPEFAAGELDGTLD